MSDHFDSVLRKFKPRALLEVKRNIKGTESTIGFLVGFSGSFVLFHTLDMSVFQLNGYTAVRNEDIKEYRVIDKPAYWQFRATRKLRLEPVIPNGIDITSPGSLVESAGRSHPVLTFHVESRKPDICYIGSFVSMSERTFTIEELDPNAEWSGHRRLRLADVTRIDFGGGYENALASNAPKLNRAPPRN